MIKVFYGMSALAASMVTLLMGSFVFSRDPKNITYRLFLLINFAVSIWCFSSFVFSITDNIRIAFLWNNISYFAGAFIPAFFLHFIFSLTGAHKDRILFVVYVMAAGLGLANFSPLFVEEMISRLPYYNFLPIPNYLYHLFVGFFMLTLIFAYYSLVQAYRQVKGEQKNHLLYLIIGSAIGFLGTIDFFLVVYDMQPRLPFPHDILIIAYTLIFAYAILRFRLMDIEIVIKRGVVYSTLTAILTGIFISIVLVWEKIFIGITGYGSIWIGIIVAFVIAVIFQPLRDSVQEIVDTYFFHVRYDYQRILRRYSHALAQPMVDLNRFSRLAPYLLTKSMKLAGSAVTVLDRDTQTYILRAGERNAQDLEGTVLGNDSSLMTEIKGTLNEVSLEEIENRLRDEDLSKAERMKLHKIATEMKNLKTVLVIPCVSESHYFKIPTLISTLNLGKKLSEENFSREDIQFLKTLANQATISIEYAFIFEELKRHQERVLRSEKLAAIGTTTAGVAHELKNPLTYLSAVSQVLHRKWDDPEFKKSVSEMLPSEV